GAHSMRRADAAPQPVPRGGCESRRGRGEAPRPHGPAGEGGVTLVELLVVIIVLGLLVGLVGPRLWGRVGQSKQAAARAQIELLGAGLDQYRLAGGSLPTAAAEGADGAPGGEGESADIVSWDVAQK